MRTLRRSGERGHFDHGWLDTWHSFSFGDYHDPAHMGFRSLRVINEDFIAPGAGFPTHGHRNMEIISLVLSGALEHRDSMGNGAVIRPGEIQRMTAGSGVRHSEFNASPDAPVHLVQIWILPSEQNLEPGYEQRAIPSSAGRGATLLASRDGRDGSVKINQDALLWLIRLQAGEEHVLELDPSRGAWLQTLEGTLRGGESLSAGDALAISGERSITLRAETPVTLLYFDLA